MNFQYRLSLIILGYSKTLFAMWDCLLHKSHHGKHWKMLQQEFLFTDVVAII